MPVDSDSSELQPAKRQKRELKADTSTSLVRSTTPQPQKVNVKGLGYLKNFITPEEATELLTYIDNQPWRKDLQRRVQHYGWVYNYKNRSVSPADCLGPLPEPFQKLAEKMVSQRLTNTQFDQVIVNEYKPGQGIGKHIDQPQMFGPEIVTISLGSACTMRFSRGQTHYDVMLEPCSIALLRDEARYKWTHAIPARVTDVTTEGIPYERTRRVSLTFRQVQKIQK